MTGRHRAPGLASMWSHPDDFTPRHCAGTSCLHSHPGEPALPVFAGLHTPVVRCDRKGAHGGHDITTPGGDYRCPGLASGLLPAPVVARRVAEVRAEIRGGA